ncbi:MAG TPA: hypothetical protein VK589_09980 [Chryseolinea sp.]|nr:hypothetical protein [Chryseolinea sp.]
MKTNPLLKRILFLAVAVPAAVIVGIFSAGFTLNKPSSPWNQLGISESRATENIRQSFLEGYLYSYGASSAKNIASGDRAAIALDVLNYTKSYVASPAFIKAYENARITATPLKPLPPKTKEQIQNEKIAELDKTIAEGEKSMKSLPKDLIEPFKEVQQMLNDQKKDYENPDSEMLALLVTSENYMHANAVTKYEQQLQQWQKDYPADHKMMVKARLETFLQITGDVDFNAALKEEYRVKKFVNRAYEKKPDEWKMAYRAGRPAVEAARTFAKTWLAELK